MHMNPMTEFRTPAVRRLYPESAAIVAILLLAYVNTAIRLIFG